MCFEFFACARGQQATQRDSATFEVRTFEKRQHLPHSTTQSLIKGFTMQRMPHLFSFIASKMP